MPKPKNKCPNPLFEKWIQEWKEEAIKRDTVQQFWFSKALASLRRYPLPLASGKDCLILQNFGKKLCDMLDKKLEQHRELYGIEPEVPVNLPAVSSIEGSNSLLLGDESENRENEVIPRKRKKVHNFFFNFAYIYFFIIQINFEKNNMYFSLYHYFFQFLVNE